MKSQFYLVENPKHNDVTDQFIFHAKPPRFMARIISFQDEFEIATAAYEGANITFFYITPESLREVYTLVADQLFDQHTPEQIDAKLKRMADWWIDYLMWEDRQEYGRGGKKELLADYNEQTPGLKIIYGSGKWCVIYKGFVKVFEAEPLMDDFLINKLNFLDDHLNEGVINNL